MSEIDGDESSDLLIDLQIEESLGRETLMSIDSSNHMDDTVTIAVYLLLLLLNIAVAYFGPNTVENSVLDFFRMYWTVAGRNVHETMIQELVA